MQKTKKEILDFNMKKGLDAQKAAGDPSNLDAAIRFYTNVSNFR